MRENSVAKVVRITGRCIITVGVIGAFVLGYALPTVTYSAHGGLDESYNWGLTVGVIAGSVVGGIFFQAVAEIIRLLQLNADKTEDLIKATNGRAGGIGHGSSTVRDIESNLPKI